MIHHSIQKEEVLGLIHNNFEGTEERKAEVFDVMNKILLKTYIFSTFFFPLLKGLRKVDNKATKEKVIKWARDSHLFEREFVLFPIFKSCHFSLALFCYPNKFKEYIQHKRIVNGIDYSQTKRADVDTVNHVDKFVKVWIADSRIALFGVSRFIRRRRLRGMLPDPLFNVYSFTE